MKYGDPIFPQLWKDENVKTFSVTPGWCFSTHKPFI
jgi:hypothetical protein